MKKKKILKRFLAFNKEILFGELGALVSAPAMSSLVSQISSNPKLISSSAVFGALVGSALFWFVMRVYDRKVRNELTLKELSNDFVYLTPAASFLVVTIYYPLLYSFSYNNLISGRYSVILSVIISQAVAFSAFLIMINLYRFILRKFFNKIL